MSKQSNKIESKVVYIGYLIDLHKFLIGCYVLIWDLELLDEDFHGTMAHVM
jgi:hypothetical protein